jgi:hypothetical protein
MERRRRFLFRELFGDAFTISLPAGFAGARLSHTGLDRYDDAGKTLDLPGNPHGINNFLKWSGLRHQSGPLTV